MNEYVKSSDHTTNLALGNNLLPVLGVWNLASVLSVMQPENNGICCISEHSQSDSLV